jgi:hypothetical protein
MQARGPIRRGARSKARALLWRAAGADPSADQPRDLAGLEQLLSRVGADFAPLPTLHDPPGVEADPGTPQERIQRRRGCTHVLSMQDVCQHQAQATRLPARKRPCLHALHRGHELAACELNGLRRALLVDQLLVGGCFAGVDEPGVVVGQELVGIPQVPILGAQRFYAVHGRAV